MSDRVAGTLTGVSGGGAVCGWQGVLARGHDSVVRQCQGGPTLAALEAGGPIPPQRSTAPAAVSHSAPAAAAHGSNVLRTIERGRVAVRPRSAMQRPRSAGATGGSAAAGGTQRHRRLAAVGAEGARSTEEEHSALMQSLLSALLNLDSVVSQLECAAAAGNTAGAPPGMREVEEVAAAGAAVAQLEAAGAGDRERRQMRLHGGNIAISERELGQARSDQCCRCVHTQPPNHGCSSLPPARQCLRRHTCDFGPARSRESEWRWRFCGCRRRHRWLRGCGARR